MYLRTILSPEIPFDTSASEAMSTRQRGETALAMLDSLEDELQTERNEPRQRGETAAALDDLDALADTLATLPGGVRSSAAGVSRASAAGDAHGMNPASGVGDGLGESPSAFVKGPSDEPAPSGTNPAFDWNAAGESAPIGAPSAPPGAENLAFNWNAMPQPLPAVTPALGGASGANPSFKIADPGARASAVGEVTAAAITSAVSDAGSNPSFGFVDLSIPSERESTRDARSATSDFSIRSSVIGEPASGVPDSRSSLASNPSFTPDQFSIRASIIGEPAVPTTEQAVHVETPPLPPAMPVFDMPMLPPPGTPDALPHSHAADPMAVAYGVPLPVPAEPATPTAVNAPAKYDSGSRPGSVALTESAKKITAEQPVPAQQGAMVSKFFPKKDTASASTITSVALSTIAAKPVTDRLDDLLADTDPSLKRPVSLFDDGAPSAIVQPTTVAAAAQTRAPAPAYAPIEAAAAPPPEAPKSAEPQEEALPTHPAPAPAFTNPLSFLPPVQSRSPQPAPVSPAAPQHPAVAAAAAGPRNPFDSPVGSARASQADFAQHFVPSPSPTTIFAAPVPTPTHAAAAPQQQAPPPLVRKSSSSLLLVTPTVSTAPSVMLTPADNDEEQAALNDALASAGLAPVVSIKPDPNDSPLLVRLGASLHSLLECGVTGSVPQSTSAAKAMREAVGELELSAASRQDLDPMTDTLREDVRGMIALLKGLLADPSPAVQLDFAAHARKLMASSRRVQIALMEEPLPPARAPSMTQSSGLSEFEAGLRAQSVSAAAQPAAESRRDSATQGRATSGTGGSSSAGPAHAPAERAVASSGGAGQAPSPSMAGSSVAPKVSDASQKTANKQTGNTAPLLVAQVAATYQTSGWGAGKPQPFDPPPEKQRSCVDSCIVM